MSKVVIAGNAVVIKSALKLEDLKTISKYRPKALTLMSEDGKEPLFAIDVGIGCGNINEYGATFGSASHDEEKLACITMCMDGVTGDVKEAIADQFGSAIISLNKLEATLPAVLSELQAEKAAVISSISYAE